MHLCSFLVVLPFLWIVKDGLVLGDDEKESDVAAQVKEQIRVLRTSTDERQQWQAIEKLGKIGTPAVPPLLELLRDPDPKLRAAAAWAFSGQKQSVVAPAVPDLIKAMRSEKDRTVLGELASSLTTAKEAAVPELVELVRTTTGELRRTAFYSLSHMRGAARAAVPTLTELLKDKDQEVRERAVYVLGRIGPDAKSAVPALLKVPDSSGKARRALIDALGSIGEASEEVLRVVFKALKDPDPKIRSAAVYACAAFGPKAKAAVPDLIRLLDDAEVNSRSTHPTPVVNALGRVGPAAKVAGPKLVALLKDPDIEYATFAAEALLRIGIEEMAAVPVFGRALDKSLHRDKAYIRFRTFRVVRRMGPAAKPLVPRLLSIAKDKHEDRRIRFQAVLALQKVDPEAAKEIEKQCSAPDS